MQLGMRNRWNVNAESARWMRMLLDAVRRVDKRFAEAEVGALVVLIRVGVAVGLFACDPAARRGILGRDTFDVAFVGEDE